MRRYLLTHILFSMIAVWVAFGGLAAYKNATFRQRIALTFAMLCCFAGGLRYVLGTIVAKLRTPPAWDIGIYWTWARVALTSHRVYDPASNLAIGLSVARDAIWRHEVIDRGFLYPPTTILLLAPLGLFPTYQSAAPWWYALNGTALLLAIALLWRIYFQQHGLIGLLATAVLVFAFPATAQTFFMGQPIPIALLLLTLYTADAARLRGGLWLALALIVKPFALLLFLEPLCKRRFAQAGVAVAAVAVAALLTVALLGAQNASQYFTNGPDRRYGADVWLSPADSNESLFSAVVRFSHQAVPHGFLQDPLFLLCAAALTVATIVLCSLLKDSPDNDKVSLSLLIPLALLVYPPTGIHYNSILLIPIFTLWRELESTRPVAAALFISAIYGLLVTWTVFSFLGPLSIWFAFAGLAIARTRGALALRPA